MRLSLLGHDCVLSSMVPPCWAPLQSQHNQLTGYYRLVVMCPRPAHGSADDQAWARPKPSLTYATARGGVRRHSCPGDGSARLHGRGALCPVVVGGTRARVRFRWTAVSCPALCNWAQSPLAQRAPPGQGNAKTLLKICFFGIVLAGAGGHPPSKSPPTPYTWKGADNDRCVHLHRKESADEAAM